MVNKTKNTRLNTALAEAEGMLGTPYCPSGDSPKCFDCSGLMVFCFQHAGVDLPRISRDMANIGTSVAIPDLEPGDLVFFSTNGKLISHVGMFYGDNTFIHSSTSNGVMVSSMLDAYWKPRFVRARRIAP
ncbi:MAG: C40 family peptidase [Ignavibacteria bacterium]|nr:C40 family peptidase [Ignavibacteria bacterium]